MNATSPLIIGTCLIIAAFLIGGRYQVAVSQDDMSVLYVIDRFTGNVNFCRGKTCRSSNMELTPANSASTSNTPKAVDKAVEEAFKEVFPESYEKLFPESR
jgi:hypothetical protein